MTTIVLYSLYNGWSPDAGSIIASLWWVRKQLPCWYIPLQSGPLCFNLKCKKSDQEIIKQRKPITWREHNRPSNIKEKLIICHSMIKIYLFAFGKARVLVLAWPKMCPGTPTQQEFHTFLFQPNRKSKEIQIDHWLQRRTRGTMASKNILAIRVSREESWFQREVPI